MKLTFGLALDGFRLAPGAVAFGELTCGPAGMLDGLKVRLCFERRWATAVVLGVLVLAVNCFRLVACRPLTNPSPWMF